MTLKRRIKHWLYGWCPGFAGSFPYFGERLHFPRGSLLFDLACEQGIFEEDNLRLLQGAVRENSWYFDVGANIGLMSAPLLHSRDRVTVVSVEASPHTGAFLKRSVDGSPRRGQWKFEGLALGAQDGQATFFTSAPSHGAFDGLRDTGRGRTARAITVAMSRLDTLWHRHGEPDVSCIKIDVEGAESEILAGAEACLAACRPVIMLEWNAENLAAYHRSPDSLFSLADRLRYEIFAAPHLTPVHGPVPLRIQMNLGETFVLIPSA